MRLVRRGNFTVDSNYRGAYGFTGFVTGGLGQLSSQEQAGLAGEMGLPCAATGTCQFGNSVADALLGLPQYWLNGFQEYISGAFGEYDFFVQDDWRVRPHLTLNLGLALRVQEPGDGEEQRLFQLRLQQWGSDGGGNQAPQPCGALTPARIPTPANMQINPQPCTAQTCAQQTLNLGSTARNRSLQYPDRKNFEPRIGIAWQPFK